MKKALLLLITALLCAGCSSLLPRATPPPAAATETPDLFVPAPTAAAGQDYLGLGIDLAEGEALGGLRLGMAEAEVTELLGQPLQASEPEVWAADGRLHSVWDYPSQGLSLGMAGGRGAMAVSSISAMAPCALLTRRGIGIGSAKDAVLAAYGEYVDGENAVMQDRIVIGSVYGGIIVTLEGGLAASLFIGASAE